VSNPTAGALLKRGEEFGGLSNCYHELSGKSLRGAKYIHSTGLRMKKVREGGWCVTGHTIGACQVSILYKKG